MSSNTVAPAPRIVVFLDSQYGFPAAQALRGDIDPKITIYLILAFYQKRGLVDAAKKWEEYSQKEEYVKQLHSSNIKIMVSVGGGNVHPTSEGWVSEDTANDVAQFVKNNYLDGADLDWEDTDALLRDPPNAFKWIVTFTQTLRNKLGENSVISHSVAPAYFCPTFPDGKPEAQKLYYKVDQSVGPIIDWYNIMFYDTGDYHDYESVEALIETSYYGNLPGSALLQIAENSDYKSSINKLVIGKPVLKTDCYSGGYMTGALLAESVQLAIKKTADKPEPWKAGIMGWQWHDPGSSFHEFANPSATHFKPT